MGVSILSIVVTEYSKEISSEKFNTTSENNLAWCQRSVDKLGLPCALCRRFDCECSWREINLETKAKTTVLLKYKKVFKNKMF
jgi:hypothetical protein